MSDASIPHKLMQQNLLGISICFVTEFKILSIYAYLLKDLQDLAFKVDFIGKD